MAKTFPTHGLKVTTPGQPAASWLRQTLPKASATTFPVGSPIKMASGLVLEWVNPSDADIVAFDPATFRDRYYEADTLKHMGDTYHAAGDDGAALAVWREALEILDQLGHPDATEVRSKLTTSAAPTGPR